VALEQVGALAGVGQRFDAAEFGFLFAELDGLDAELPE
jgi:hypothetical protein